MSHKNPATTIQVSAVVDGGAVAWCWWANEDDWGAGANRYIDAQSITHNIWFAAGEARRRFGHHPIHIITDNANLYEFLNTRRRKMAKRDWKKLTRNQRAFTRRKALYQVTCALGDVTRSEQKADQVLYSGDVGPSAAYTYGGYTTIANEKATIVFVDGSQKNEHAGWAAIAGNEILAAGRIKTNSIVLAEMTAITEAYNAIKTAYGVIFTDNQRAIHAATQKQASWKPTVKPAAALLHETAQAHPYIELRYVKGHSGVPGNHRADLVAGLVRNEKLFTVKEKPLCEWVIPDDANQNWET